MVARTTKPRWETPDPPGVKGSYGPKVMAWAQRELGITLGPWQAYIVRKVLRHDVNGDLIHRLALISTGRQNGKSVIVRAIFGWLLDEGRELAPFAGWTTLLAAAHDAKQARIIYNGVYNDLSSIERLYEQSKGKRYGRGVKLTEHFGVQVGNLMLDTVTSQPGSSRGLSAGAIAWDEVNTQHDWRQWEALSPTQSAQRSPIMLVTSTAGDDQSIVLQALYDRLVRQATGAEKPDPAFYGAWWQSTEPDAGLDWKQIKLANPALDDGRLSRSFVLSENATLPRSSWKRERMNHWVDSRAESSAFRPEVWAALRTPYPLKDAPEPYALGIGVAPGWERATVAVAAIRADGRIGVEIWRDLRENVTPGTITDAIEAFGHTRWAQTIAYDASSGGAGEFMRHGEEAGLAYDALKPGAMVAATMDASEMIMAGRLAVDDPLLDHQIPGVVKRMVGADGAFRFSRGDSLGPIDAVEAMVLAAHAIAFTKVPGLH